MEAERQSHARRSKMGLLDRVGSLFLSAGPRRAASEAFFLSAILVLGIFLSTRGQPYVADQGVLPTLVVGPLSAMLCAARMRLRTQFRPEGWREDTLKKVVTGAFIVALITLPGSVLMLVAVIGSVAELPIVLFVFFFWNAGAFAFFRAMAYLWPRWVRLRRSRLRWEMTHTTLAVVAAVSSVVTLVFVLLSSFGPALPSNTGLNPFQELFVVALPVLGVMIFLTVVVLGIVLPPAALVSYFAARRTTERLESLTHGTSGIREGNVGIRVRVDGEDEVSDLQRDFNAMADDLGRAMRDLRSERDNVERLLKTQRELVASVSHELRTPVATMRGYLESALDGKSKEQNGERRILEVLQDDLEIMGREAIRLQRLIDDLFTLSRAEAGRLSLEIRPTDTAALLSRCAAAVSEGAWRTGKVEVIQDSEANLPPALADEGRLEQAVRNLLSNAVRHTPPGGIVALSAAAEPDAVVIEVKDTGEGISPDDLDRAFERFYRSDGARQRDHSGAGLGLAIVKELTEAMGGSVHVESEPGSGSRFVLRLPHA